MAYPNIKKLKIFFEVTHKLNELGITPILFGSLGLYKSINQLDKKVNDIDILVPDEFLAEKWGRLLNALRGLGFDLKINTNMNL